MFYRVKLGTFRPYSFRENSKEKDFLRAHELTVNLAITWRLKLSRRYTTRVVSPLHRYEVQFLKHLSMKNQKENNYHFNSNLVL